MEELDKLAEEFFGEFGFETCTLDQKKDLLNLYLKGDYTFKETNKLINEKS